jgi:PadR family transcriptional regulator PadR
MARTKSDLLHGTLELLILQLVDDEPMNGYAIGQRIEELTHDALSVDEGSLYPALYRMEKRGWLKSSWGVSENNRRAKFYEMTRSGRRRLESERANWTSFASAVEKILGA